MTVSKLFVAMSIHVHVHVHLHMYEQGDGGKDAGKAVNGFKDGSEYRFRYRYVLGVCG
jgi:hypothetical protein